MTGSLKMLGSYIPQPEIPANDANPRGYFEPEWTVEFQKRVLADAGVRTLDARPEAYELMQPTCAKPSFQRRAEHWFATQLQGRPDRGQGPTRLLAAQPLGARCARDLGVDTAGS